MAMDANKWERVPASRQVVPAGLALMVLGFSFLLVMFLTEARRGNPAAQLVGKGTRIYGVYFQDSLIGWASLAETPGRATRSDIEMFSDLTQILLPSGAGQPQSVEVETGYSKGEHEALFCRIRRSSDKGVRVVECLFSPGTIRWRERAQGAEVTAERTISAPRAGAVLLEELTLGHWQRLVRRFWPESSEAEPEPVDLLVFRPETCEFSRVNCIPMGEIYRSIAGEQKQCLALQVNGEAFVYFGPKNRFIEELNLPGRQMTFVREDTSVLERLPTIRQREQPFLPPP